MKKYILLTRNNVGHTIAVISDLRQPRYKTVKDSTTSSLKSKCLFSILGRNISTFDATFISVNEQLHDRLVVQACC